MTGNPGTTPLMATVAGVATSLQSIVTTGGSPRATSYSRRGDEAPQATTSQTGPGGYPARRFTVLVLAATQGFRDGPFRRGQDTLTWRLLPPGFLGRVSCSTPSLYWAAAAS